MVNESPVLEPLKFYCISLSSSDFIRGLGVEKYRYAVICAFLSLDAFPIEHSMFNEYSLALQMVSVFFLISSLFPIFSCKVCSEY